ncbi:MAG: hypothetical protein QM754_04605 [Tepidisphaeraceae bacterium]
MFHKSIAAVAALASVSAAVAATVSIIPTSSLPSNAPRVQFESLPVGESVMATSYQELGLTVTATRMAGYVPSFIPGSTVVMSTWSTATPTLLFSFDSPVSQIAMTEYLQPVTAVTLFSDAAGTQSLGTFSAIHTTKTYLQGESFAFGSDTSFRSFSIAVGGTGSYMIDDLRYANAVPEPSVLIAGLGAVSAYYGLQRRRRA